MAFEEIRHQLKSVVEDEENRVIALSGVWGTGKTHLWNEIKKESDMAPVNDALYASLFGLNDIATLKVKLAEQVLANNPSKKLSAAFDALNKSRGILQRLMPKAGILEDVALLAAPKLLQGRFVVVDDVERKGKQLDIDEVLGFIDEHINSYNVRFLIIMNTERLKDAETWNHLREKVVDHEIMLKSSPNEAFEVANSISPSIYEEMVSRSITICGITNIRVVRKVIKAVNFILRGHERLPKASLERIIPSTVLLAGAHYRGIPDGPSIKFILNPDKPDLPSESDADLTEEEVKSEEDKKVWNKLIEDLGILSPDDYEPIVADFLVSGLVKRERLDEILLRYESDHQLQEANQKLMTFYNLYRWGVEKSEDELYQMASAIGAKAHLLDMRTVSSFVSEISKYSGWVDLAENVIDRWMDSHADSIKLFSSEFYHDREYLHPRILAAVDGAQENKNKDITVLDVCNRIVKYKSWGKSHEMALNNKTVDDFKSAIVKATIEERAFILKQLFRMSDEYSEKSYGGFGPAVHTFRDFCAEVMAGEDCRLKDIIARMVNHFGMDLTTTIS